MVTFTETTFHELLDSDKTTPSTVLDSDGKLKQSLHNMFPTTDVTDTDHWTQTNITVTESGTSPSGKAAYLLTEGTNVGANFRLYDGISVVSGRYYALSVDVKRGSGSRDISFELGSGGFGSSIRWNLDLDTGDVTSQVNGTKDAAIATELSDGWWTFTVYAQATSSAFPTFNYYLSNGTDISYNGDGTSSIYISRPRVYEASVHVPVERVENGTFDSDITGWSDASSAGGAVSWNSSGYMDIVNTSGTARANQDINVVDGETYRISVDVIAVGASCVAYLEGNVLGDLDDLGTGTHVFTHTSTRTSSSETLQFSSFAGTLTIDNVSVTKVINDGIQNDLDGEDFIETSGSAIYHSSLEYNGDGSFRGIQSFEARSNLQTRPHPQDGVSSWTNDTNMDITYDHADLFGDRNAAKLIPTTTSGSHYRGNNISIGSTATHTMSCFVKADGINWVALWFGGADQAVQDRATFNLSTGAVGTSEQGSPDAKRIEDYGDGWYRISMTSTVNASGSFAPLVMALDSDNVGTTFAGDGTDGFFIVGTQVELGSSPSPYIPTNNATRSRNSDTLYKPLSEFGFNKNEYSVLVEFEAAGSDGADFPRMWQIDNGTNNIRTQLIFGVTNAVNYNVYNGSSQALVNNILTSYTAYDKHTVITSARSGDQNASVDGGSVIAGNDNSAAFEDVNDQVTTLRVGAGHAGSQLNGHLKRLIIWPKQLTNDTIVAESE